MRRATLAGSLRPFPGRGASRSSASTRVARTVDAPLIRDRFKRGVSNDPESARDMRPGAGAGNASPLAVSTHNRSPISTFGGNPDTKPASSNDRVSLTGHEAPSSGGYNRLARVLKSKSRSRTDSAIRRGPRCSRLRTGFRSLVSGNTRKALPRMTLPLIFCLI